ncbi:HD domain-containing protein, partial [Micromonospora sp. DH15]|nr:HD domain-containing protein [Micromonospora sp. DH15]
MPPPAGDLKALRDRPYLLGVDGLWPQVREELLDWMSQHAEVTTRLPVWREAALPQPVQVLLTAIVIVADWIASNDDLFPYGFQRENAPDRLAQAWDELDLPTPWQAVDVSGLDISTLFSRRFELPAGT